MKAEMETLDFSIDCVRKGSQLTDQKLWNKVTMHRVQVAWGCSGLAGRRSWVRILSVWILNVLLVVSGFLPQSKTMQLRLIVEPTLTQV